MTGYGITSQRIFTFFLSAHSNFHYAKTIKEILEQARTQAYIARFTEAKFSPF
jgi:hypothetical protein